MKVLALTLTVVTLFGITHGAPQGYNYQAPVSQGYQAPAAAAAPVSYNFGYDVNAVDNYQRPVQFGHNEGREGYSATGSYYVLLPDGRLMTVNYVADQYGFRPTYSFQQVNGGQAAKPSAPGQLYSTPHGK